MYSSWGLPIPLPEGRTFWHTCSLPWPTRAPAWPGAGQPCHAPPAGPAADSGGPAAPRASSARRAPVRAAQPRTQQQMGGLVSPCACWTPRHLYTYAGSRLQQRLPLASRTAAGCLCACLQADPGLPEGWPALGLSGPATPALAYPGLPAHRISAGRRGLDGCQVSKMLTCTGRRPKVWYSDWQLDLSKLQRVDQSIKIC